MATLNSAIQALVDNLHGKMTGSEPLTAEEQTLVASAIEKLSSHTSWEQALVAVAEEHLNEATQNLSATLTTATSALTNAENDINQARDTIQTQNANLAIIPQISTDVETALNSFSTSSNTAITSNLAGMARPVFGVNLIETAATSSNNQRSPAIFAVYDSSGESFVARPSFITSTASTENLRLEYLKLLADGSGKSVTTTHFVDSGTFYATPTTRIYRYGSSAILPLATKDDVNDIEYDVVYSTQDSAASTVATYQGVYCRSSGNVTVTKPKLNVDAVDQWGISTITDQSWNNVAVLYDNNKHCLVMVDDNSSLLVEKYRDGNVITTTSIANNAALQTYVDNGDFTVVKFISHHLPWPYCVRKYDGAESSTNLSHYLDCHGFYGKLGNAVRMGGEKYNAHYRFTTEKKLEPVNYFFASSVNYHRYHSSYGVDAAKGDLKVSITDMQGNILGTYSYQSKADYFGHHTGYMASALMCMNPYSHVGILNETQIHNHGATPYYGHGRTCKAF